MSTFQIILYLKYVTYHPKPNKPLNCITMRIAILLEFCLHCIIAELYMDGSIQNFGQFMELNAGIELLLFCTN